MKRAIMFLLILVCVFFPASPYLQAGLQSFPPESSQASPFGAYDKARQTRLREQIAAPYRMLSAPGRPDVQANRTNRLAAEKARSSSLADQFAASYLVQFNETASPEQIAACLTGETYTPVGPGSKRLIHLVCDDINGFMLKAGPWVRHARQDSRLDALLVPNDTFYPEQWALDAVNAPGAWDYTTGNAPSGEAAVYVAVIDSGIDRYHTEIGQADIRNGWDYYWDDYCDWDASGHGTNVSGIIGAATNNADGIAGMCWNIAIVPMRVMDIDGTIYHSILLQAIYDAADLGCQIINLSLGGSTYSDLLDEAIQYAYSKGCIVIASAGNDGDSQYMYPASYDHVISVGSVNQALNRSEFSNYNDKVDVCAPGEAIVTTHASYHEPYGDYIIGSGTSYSAPYVSGIAALAASLDPAMNHESFLDLITRSSTDLGTSGKDPAFGYGLINAQALIKLMQPAPPAPSVRYQSHVQNIGWQDWVSDGAVSGTSGEAKRLEAVRITLDNLDGGVTYRTHVQNIGWMDWVTDGALSGTEGQSLRLEAIDMQLTGEAALHYDLYYRVHAQNLGWMDWANNGQSAGTAGYAYRLEAMQVVLVPRGDPAPGPTARPFVDRNALLPSVSYQSHVQNIGWQDWVSDGQTSGTSGKALRLEAIRIALANTASGIQYRTHVQNIGWMGWVADGALSGTEGKSLRLEAIDIQLTGSIALLYDVYYRVHAQNIGWMDWGKNGQSAGTAGFAYRLEAIQIVLVPKGASAPGPTAVPFVSR